MKMRNVFLLCIVSIFILSGCGDMVDNIEVTTLNTGVTVNGKKIGSADIKTSAEETSSQSTEETSSQSTEETSTRAETKPSTVESTSFVELTASELSTEITTEESRSETSASENMTTTVSESVASTTESTTLAMESQTLSSSSSNGIDVDLSMMNQTMAYSQLYAMMLNPNDYIGKIVKIAGIYNSAQENGNTYHFVIVADQAACCQMGMEFKLDDGLYYPPDTADVCVTGVFQSYEEEGRIWYYLQTYNIY